jgi:hypothetical protein
MNFNEQYYKSMQELEGTKMIKPVTPNEARKNFTYHPTVVEAFNEVLIRNAHRSAITILQKDIIKLVKKKNPDLTSEYIFANQLLDIESLFEQYGWKVNYNKPAYNESFEAYWEIELELTFNELVYLTGILQFTPYDHLGSTVWIRNRTFGQTVNEINEELKQKITELFYTHLQIHKE